MRLAIQNMARFSASFPTTFRCCCSRSRKSVCLKHWMEVWRRKESVKSSRIYFSIANIWRHFRGLTRCCLSTVRKLSLQAKPVKKKFRMKIVKQRRRTKRQSKYKYKDVFHIFSMQTIFCLLVFLSFPCEEMSAEGESCSSTAKLCAIILMCAHYLTQSMQSYHHFLMSTQNKISTPEPARLRSAANQKNRGLWERDCLE